MDKDLGWFKFSPLKWMTGRIKKESAKVQIAFCDLMCQYWKKKCDMTVEQAELEIGDSLAILLKRKIVKQDGDKIKIEFLDEQMVCIADTSVKRSNAAKSKWSKEHSKTMQVHASALQNCNGALQIDADKIREDKIREDFKSDWIEWGNLIVEKRDHHWDAMHGRKVSQDEMDAFLSVATRNNWKMETQQEFRISLKGFRVTSSATTEQKNKYKVQ